MQVGNCADALRRLLWEARCGIVTTFIDGYNLIFAASSRMAGFDIERTEAARDRLLDMLSKYRAARPHRVVVFFDGGAEAAHLPRRQMIRGVDVVFSDVKSDADTDIKNAVAHENRPREVRVITSDRAIQNFVQRYGTQVIDSRVFLDELDVALKESELPGNEPLEKYEGAAGDDIDYWLRMFGEDNSESDK